MLPVAREHQPGVILQATQLGEINVHRDRWKLRLQCASGFLQRGQRVSQPIVGTDQRMTRALEHADVAVEINQSRECRC